MEENESAELEEELKKFKMQIFSSKNILHRTNDPLSVEAKDRVSQIYEENGNNLKAEHHREIGTLLYYTEESIENFIKQIN